jgi:hypothetical protein
MSITSDNKDLPGADAQPAPKLKALMRRWHEALAEIRDSLLPGERRQKIETSRRDVCAPESDPGVQLMQVADDGPEPISADSSTSDGETAQRELVPLPGDRSQALAVLCDRLLQDLDGADVKAAEIRFVVHKHEHPGYPQPHPESPARSGEDDLLWELRRLIAWSGGTIADVAHALETRGADLDENARELLRDEAAALDVDLATLNVHLADPVDWDGEFQYLLAGEVAPFNDFAVDEDDENDD